MSRSWRGSKSGNSTRYSVAISPSQIPVAAPSPIPCSHLQSQQAFCTSLCCIFSVLAVVWSMLVSVAASLFTHHLPLWAEPLASLWSWPQDQVPRVFLYAFLIHCTLASGHRIFLQGWKNSWSWSRIREDCPLCSQNSVFIWGCFFF